MEKSNIISKEMQTIFKKRKCLIICFQTLRPVVIRCLLFRKQITNKHLSEVVSIKNKEVNPERQKLNIDR